jgi:hypothetical protein
MLIYAKKQKYIPEQQGVFQFFVSGNMQRIEIRWNNMLPSRWL